MKSVVSTVMLSAMLSAVPTHAGEVGLLIDKQIGVSQVFSGNDFDASKPNGWGLRGAYTVLDLKVAELGLTATYHKKSKTDLVLNGVDSGTFSNQYVAVGAQVDWKFLVNLHAGIDIRREKLATESVSGVSDGSTTITRPWVKAGIGFSVPTPVVSPFVRLEMAMATRKHGNLSATSTSDDFRKAMAPEYQIGLYGGIRF